MGVHGREAQAATVDVSVAASSDDAREPAAGTPVLTDYNPVVNFWGESPTLGLRFTGITIPAGAKITDAYLSFFSRETQSGSCTGWIAAHDTASPATFTTTDGNVDTRVKTTAQVSWSPPAWTGDTWAANSPDISSVIQELVDSYGPYNNGSIVMLSGYTSGSGGRLAYSFDTHATNRPILHIAYSLGPTLTAFSDSPDPADVGETITFTLDWNDSPGAQVKVHFCKTNAITASATGGSCPGGTWVSSASLTTSDPKTETYTVLAADPRPIVYYAFVCANTSLCSGTTSNAGDVIVNGSWYNTNWLYRQRLTVAPGQVANTTQTNFPVYVDLAGLSSGFFSHVNSQGSDIVVTDADGTTKLKRELAAINTGTSTGELHFKAPSLSASTPTYFYIYYGNAAATEVNDTDVWDANFKMVHHLKDLTTSSTDDSTSNNRDGTKMAANLPAETTGQVGKAQNFDGTDYLTASPPKPSMPLTFEFWVKPTSATPIGIFDTAPGQADTLRNYVGGEVEWWNSTPEVILNLTANTWVHLAFVYRTSGGNRIIDWYKNGVAQTSGQAVGSTTFAWATPIHFGQYNNGEGRYGGLLDELRLSDVARSADWIKTCFNNQRDPSQFYVVGGEQPLNPQTTLENVVLEKATVNAK